MSILWALCYYQEGIHLAIYEPEKKKKMKIENQRDHTMHIFPRVLNMTQEELVVFPQCFPFPCSLPFSISGIFLPLSKKLKKKKRKNKVLTLYFP